MKVICYRCGGGEAPENSIAGIENCISVDPSCTIEMDLQMTKDGHVVLLHDDSLVRTYNENVLISQLCLKDLQEFQIPALVQILESYSQQKWVFDIHCYNLNIVEEIISIIDRFDIERNCTIVSESDQIIKSVKKKRPHWKVAAAKREARKFIGINKVSLGRWGNLNSDILAIPERIGRIPLLSQQLVNRTHALDKELWVFGGELSEILEERKQNLPISSQKHTTQDVTKYENLGVDAIFTDFPRHLSEMQCSI